MGVFITNGENAESETLCVHCEVCVCVFLLLVNPRGGKPPALTSEAGSHGSPRHTAVVCGFSFNFYLLFVPPPNLKAPERNDGFYWHGILFEEPNSNDREATQTGWVK